MTTTTKKLTSEKVSDIFRSPLIAEQYKMRQVIAKLEDEALISDDGQHVY